MKSMELKVPPIVLVAICLLLIWFINDGEMGAFLPFSLRSILWILTSMTSGVICILGVWEFKRYQTTVNPMTPECSASLVQTGLYRYTRNPMYLGFAVFIFGCSVFAGGMLTLLITPVFIVYMTMFQIKPEERALEQMFGLEYLEYKQKVRRWL